jgi:hypothetical protein
LANAFSAMYLHGPVDDLQRHAGDNELAANLHLMAIHKLFISDTYFGDANFLQCALGLELVNLSTRVNKKN